MASTAFYHDRGGQQHADKNSSQVVIALLLGEKVESDPLQNLINGTFACKNCPGNETVMEAITPVRNLHNTGVL